MAFVCQAAQHFRAIRVFEFSSGSSACYLCTPSSQWDIYVGVVRRVRSELCGTRWSDCAHTVRPVIAATSVTLAGALFPNWGECAKQPLGDFFDSFPVLQFLGGAAENQEFFGRWQETDSMGLPSQRFNRLTFASKQIVTTGVTSSRMSMEVVAGNGYSHHLSTADAMPRSVFTRKEREMIRLIADGVSPRVIAPRLALDQVQLRACLDSVFAKLAMSGRLVLLSRKAR
jgi:DNA-binding CsgD family transcriptional regulator